MDHLTPRILMLVAALACAPLVYAQSPPAAGKPPAPQEERVNETQRSKDEAEAEYYRELTRKLREPAPTPAPAKSLQQSLAENPTSSLGILAALLAASVGLLTLYVNNRAALRAQRDSQFYEALKRFGDKDSPTVRSSAAGILAQMGQRKADKILFVGALEKLFRVEGEYPYYETVFDQLVTGLVLEDNLVSLASIKNALQKLAPINPYKTIEVLRTANLDLQDDFVKALADFWGAREAGKLENIGEPLWDDVEFVSRYDQEILGYFLHKSTFRFQQLLKSASQIFNTLSPEQKKKHLIAARRNLGVIAARLRTNAELYAHTLREFSSRRIGFGSIHSDLFLANADLRRISLRNGNLSNTQLHGANLADAQLQEANLSNANMIKAILTRVKLQGAVVTGAQLQAAELWWAKLQGANLAGVRLQGTNLIRADLEGANLSYAEIDEDTNLEDANWWQAEFHDPENEIIRIRDADTTNLLETLYSRYGAAVPLNPDRVSSSVRPFITLKREGANKGKGG